MFMRDNAERIQLGGHLHVWSMSQEWVTRFQLPSIERKAVAPKSPKSGKAAMPITEAGKELAKIIKLREKLKGKKEKLKPEAQERMSELQGIVKKETKAWKKMMLEKKWTRMKAETAKRHAEKAELEKVEKAKSVWPVAPTSIDSPFSVSVSFSCFLSRLSTLFLSNLPLARLLWHDRQGTDLSRAPVLVQACIVG
jgi:hypothetical protein